VIESLQGPTFVWVNQACHEYGSRPAQFELLKPCPSHPVQQTGPVQPNPYQSVRGLN